MKKLVVILSAILFCATTLLADELIKNAQEALKSQGFYFAEVTGVNGPDTVAAIRRYQIRNGQEVTGTLTKETLQALGLAGDEQPAAPIQQAPPPVATPGPQPTVNIRRNETVRESDQNFLRRESTPRPNDPSIVQPPAQINPPPDPGGEVYESVFRRTPFENAPLELQRATIRRAQNKLELEGVYRGAIDGQPSPDTEEAIIFYQRRHQLPLSGRLDIPTLEAMRLLPGQGATQLKPFYAPDRR
jgi:peptidoglycan hydrolase-like protein with peptidoglycan-binding domain